MEGNPGFRVRRRRPLCLNFRFRPAVRRRLNPPAGDGLRSSLPAGPPAEPLKPLPTITLKRGSAERAATGHPWIYQGNVAQITGDPADGQTVQIRDAKRRFLGVGFFNSQSKIAVRILSRRREVLDEAFFLRKLSAAQTLRKKLLPEAESYRLVNAESDELSGLIVDRYAEDYCLQVSSLGMEQRLTQIHSALRQLGQTNRILERKDLATRKLEGLPVERHAPEPQEAPQKTLVNINGLSFEVDLATGHKTGFYLDQQDNYRAVARLLRSWGARSILDCFTYQGGFALHAARSAEASVLAIDQSQDAVKQAEANAAANGLTDRCRFQAANVFDWFKERQSPAERRSDTPRYDAIILDPPSFTRTRSSVPDALRGYKEIHLRALRLLRHHGLLITFCCSHHIDELSFQETVNLAASDNRQILRQVAFFPQAPDHPIIPAVPETRYLKGYAYELLPCGGRSGPEPNRRERLPEAQ